MFKDYQLCCALVFMSVLISGCGGDSSSPQSDGDTGSSGNINSTEIMDSTTNLGVISMLVSEKVGLGGTFYNIESSQSSQLIDILRTAYTPVQDTCVLDSMSIAGGDFKGLGIGDEEESILSSFLQQGNVDGSVKFVSAGDSIVFTSSAGTFREVAQQTEEEVIFYARPRDVNFSDLPDEIPPLSMTLDVPGDVFPAVSNQIFPVTAPIELTSPTPLDEVNPTTTFTWVPGTNPDAVVTIFASNYGIDLNPDIGVVCVATDDGSFTIPASTQAELGSDSIFSSYIVKRQVLKFEDLGNNTYLFMQSLSQ